MESENVASIELVEWEPKTLTTLISILTPNSYVHGSHEDGCTSACSYMV